MSCSLNEKSTELLNAKKEFQFKEADLIRQVEKLEHQIEELKNKYVCTYIRTYI